MVFIYNKIVRSKSGNSRRTFGVEICHLIRLELRIYTLYYPSDGKNLIPFIKCWHSSPQCHHSCCENIRDVIGSSLNTCFWEIIHKL